MSPEALVATALALPFAGALLVALLRRAPDAREAATLVTASALLLCVVALLGPVMAGARPGITLLEPIPGVPIALRVEPFGLLFALVASSLWIVSSVYSIGYMRGNQEERQTTFFACFALALGSTIGVAFSGNLLTLLLFYEALTFVTYPLVAHHRDEEARRGARTYLTVLVATSTVLLFPAVVWTWLAAGTLDFRPGGILAGRLPEASATALLALFMFGIGKAALMPFHRWLPAAMVAPTPVSALLHAVAVVKAGVFAVVKVAVFTFGLGASGASFDWLLYAAGFTILAASVVALRADNLKRRLAYSTVSQLSYIVLATAVLAPLSIAAAALHVATHAFGKITLFFAAGAIYTASGKTRVSELAGIGRRMPWTMGAFAVGSLSLIGIPPAAGFMSKWLMLEAAAGAGEWRVLAVLGLSTLLNAAYFLPIVHAAFFRAPADSAEAHGEAPRTMVAALTFTAAATLLLPFVSTVPMTLARGLAGLAP